jgi:two-component system C4-dicarboxylate transport sensor histidine kinase DctB
VAREVARLATAGRAAQTLVVELSGDEEATAAVSPDALKQILLNLVQNAREAAGVESRRGGARARVEIVVAGSEGEVTIDVRDDGPGIPTAILPRIFDPFFTTKGVPHGVGLGLFVAEGLARTAGGRMSAGNREGAPGAWFRVTLPAAAAVPPRAATGEQARAAG